MTGNLTQQKRVPLQVPFLFIYTDLGIFCVLGKKVVGFLGGCKKERGCELLIISELQPLFCGERGIRTPGTVTRTSV